MNTKGGQNQESAEGSFCGCKSQGLGMRMKSFTGGTEFHSDPRLRGWLIRSAPSARNGLNLVLNKE